jgi:hypothetical protein
MPQAVDQLTTTRRAVLASAVSIPVVAIAAVPTVAAQSSDADAELLALLARFDAAERCSQATFDAVETNDAWDAGEPIRDACQGEQEAIIDAICATPARSIAGLRARARSFLLWAPMMEGPVEDVAADPGLPFEPRLLAALLRDLAGEARL